jgi:hypothetical protein
MGTTTCHLEKDELYRLSLRTIVNQYQYRFESFELVGNTSIDLITAELSSNNPTKHNELLIENRSTTESTYYFCIENKLNTTLSLNISFIKGCQAGSCNNLPTNSHFLSISS